MKNPLGYIGYLLLLSVMFSIILQFTSRDYLTTFTSETKPAELPSSLSSESPSLPTNRIVEHPNGSKTYFVDLSLTITWTTELSGQFFDSSKYEVFVTSIIIQEKTYDLLKDVWDRHFKWITLFVAVLSIPIALLSLTTKRAPFLVCPFH